ncbi:MAG TPA: tripartite tricarboxylate transporter substrate binding protein [Beijerinckiaceae bacterium]
MKFAASIGKRVALALACAAGLGLASPAAQAAWPERTVTIVVPFPAGGNTDTMARLAAEYLGQKLGQAFIVENRPAGGGIVASAQVARAPADGYTLFFASAGQLVILPMLQEVNYDAEKDFKAVSVFGIGPFVLGVKASTPAKTLDEFISYAKAHKEKINAASAGVGSIGHLTAALFAKRAGFEAVFVPYRGGGPALNALVTGDVDMYFGNASELISQKDGGKIRVLAVSNEKPMEQLPGVPPVASKFPGFKTSSWNGFLVAKDTPQEIIDTLQKHVVAASKDETIVNRLSALGIEPGGPSGKEFQALIDSERPVYREAIEAAGLKMPHQK